LQYIVTANIQFDHILDGLNLAVHIATNADIKREYHQDNHAYLLHSCSVVLEVVQDCCGKIRVLYTYRMQENFNKSYLDPSLD